VNSKAVIRRFSVFVEKYKEKMCYETYHETIIEIIEEKLFNFITYDNVNNFVSPKLKEKLLLEYSKKGMIKEEFEKTEGNLLD